MGGVKEWFRSSQAVLSMLLVQLFATGMQLLSRVILVQGTFIFALIAYRHIVAALCVAPFALYFERGHAKKFTWSVCSWIFINALVGMTMALGLFYYGLRDTSATYSVNFLNLVPICTFLVSIICGMEKLGLQTWSGKAKAVGAILCVGGAIATSLYKGKDIYIFHGYHTHTNVVAHKTYMLGGTFFLVGSCLSYTAWFIIQVKLVKVFPFRYWGTMITCIMAAIQSTIIGLCLDSNQASWRLQWNLELITIVYSGALATAATFCLLSWAITIKGSTYPPMFNPLALIFVALSEALILGEPLKVGMFLGMVLIIIGLYSFLWGKNKETQCLPQPNVAAGEVASMATEPVGMQSIAIVPSSSPKDSVILEIQKT
ncbi:PREDICTED: WAT1-related protein At5g64700-like [Lupinus angustifolius]|uniref:WAT1-related protein At5g64700-like n=1 Tax=Lupinus angustifolius TaxID=3871 RepID=UPI00092FBCCE|nr:PREDICTED: WAT1-related protein At5g64700-like [Lupinus angustifolius]